MEFDLENPLALCDGTSSLFVMEADHMPSESYLESLKYGDFVVSFRREVVSSISQLSGKMDPFLSYLAVNYLDRFLSSQGMPQPKPWVLRLLALSCVSLGAKMKKTGFSLTHLQEAGGSVFDTETIERMEVLILGVLKWRMRSITPFSFLPFFISFFKVEDPQALKARATEIIFKAQNETRLLEFKPSAVAASALLSASHEQFPLQFPFFEKAILSCVYVNKECVLECYNAMQRVLKEGCEWVMDLGFEYSDTAVNVLDQHFSSCVSESEKTSHSTSTITTLRVERETKRRKVTEEFYPP